MASSTTRPTASTRPSRVSMFSEHPVTAMIVKLPTIEAGMAIAGMSVARQLPRKQKITSTTRNSDRPNATYTSSSDRSIGVELSHAIVRFMPSGNPAAMEGSCSLTARTTANVSAFD